MQCPQIFDEKNTSFAHLMNFFLIRFLKDQKLFVKEAKLFFLHQKSEGITVVFWYEISPKYSASNLNYSQIGSSIWFKIVERVKNILNSFA